MSTIQRKAVWCFGLGCVFTVAALFVWWRRPANPPPPIAIEFKGNAEFVGYGDTQYRPPYTLLVTVPELLQKSIEAEKRPRVTYSWHFFVENIYVSYWLSIDGMPYLAQETHTPKWPFGYVHGSIRESPDSRSLIVAPEFVENRWAAMVIGCLALLLFMVGRGFMRENKGQVVITA